jgi:hypothetical protein
LERLDLPQCLTQASQPPVLKQIDLMKLGPRENKPKLPAPKRAIEHLQRVDPDLRRAIRVAGMEMRWPMVIEVHRDHDPKEAANRRHPPIVSDHQVATQTTGAGACGPEKAGGLLG